MARSLASIQVQAILKATLRNSLDGSTQTASVAQGATAAPSTTLASGTSSYQADRVWGDASRSLSSGGSENIDMYDLASIDIDAGAGKDGLGQTYTIAEVTGIMIVSESTSSGTLYVGGEGSAAAWQSMFHVSGSLSDTAGVVIGPGGFLLNFNPADPAFAVADSSNHLLKIAASGGAVTYSIYVLGRSA